MTEISNEYASALFSLALEAGMKKEYGAALDKISDVFKKTPEYLEFLASPAISATERLSAAQAAFSESVPEHVMSFLQLLCEKGKVRIFAECTEAYRKLLEESEKITAAKVKSAVELTDEEKSELKQKLEKKTGHTITLECSTDSSLMGGLIIEIDGKVIDGSVKARLAEVKDVIST